MAAILASHFSLLRRIVAALVRNFTEFNGSSQLHLMSKLLGSRYWRNVTRPRCWQSMKRLRCTLQKFTIQLLIVRRYFTDAQVYLLVNTLQLPSTHLRKIPSKVLLVWARVKNICTVWHLSLQQVGTDWYNKNVNCCKGSLHAMNITSWNALCIIHIRRHVPRGCMGFFNVTKQAVGWWRLIPKIGRTPFLVTWSVCFD